MRFVLALFASLAVSSDFRAARPKLERLRTFCASNRLSRQKRMPIAAFCQRAERCTFRFPSRLNGIAFSRGGER